MPFVSDLQEREAAATVTGVPASGDVVLPSKVAEAAATLVAAHEQMNANNYDKAASIILAQSAADAVPLVDQTPAMRDATVQLWIETARWFLKLTHVSASQDRTLPVDEELRHQFQIIESTLEATLAPFYQVIDDLDAILDAANAPAAGSRETTGDGTPDRERVIHDD
jgi:hypothetical protein